MTRKRQRLYFLLLGMSALGIAVTLVLMALKQDVIYFYSPSQLTEFKVPANKRIRIGGLVEVGSVAKEGAITRFRVVDKQSGIDVAFTGLLPDLFREGQGVVAEGKLGADGGFAAAEVLAKHDENYKPKEVADALKKSGEWQREEGPAR
ncbi:MAG: cytochrome c maturation protein CcmE [Magnetospirillum sp.]|nr:cytochrome c maturation protein CcmE [Magnetospirillum sp.]